MGKYDNVINRYLSDARRFADLFNGLWFQGKEMIRPEDLQEGSERYTEGNRPRFRDVKKRFADGRTLRILALENQNLTDYTMPLRCMDYDVQEYRRQLTALCGKNRSRGNLITPAERLCGIWKTDRLAPVYTICLYHGEAGWDGPRSLRDMLELPAEGDAFSGYVADYPMHLCCVSEIQDMSVFRTELREFFSALRCRRDKKKLRELITRDEAYRHLDRDTAETLGVLLDASGNLCRSFHFQTEEKEEYDMCQALEELEAEAVEAGMKIGIEKGMKTGMERGTFQTLCALARDGLLSWEEAAKRSGMPEKEFLLRMENARQ